MNNTTSPKSSKQVQQLLSQSQQQHQAGQLGAAENGYRAALELDTHNAVALHGLGLIAYQVGKHAAAVELITKAIVSNPATPSFYNNLSLAHAALEQWDEAIDACRQALHIDPHYARAHNSLGMIARARGDNDGAINHYRAALAIDPGLADAYNNLGNTLTEKDELDEAERLLHQAIRLNPAFSEAHNNLGLVFKRQHRPHDAERCFLEAIRLNTNNIEARANLGSLYQELERRDDAIAQFQEAIQRKPDFVEAWNSLGTAHQRQGNISEAIACYQRAIELKPEFADALNNLGNAHRHLGQADKALEFFRQALAVKPDFPDASSNLLFTYSHHVLLEPEALLEAHREWDRMHGAPGRAQRFRHSGKGDPGKRLRIGYVSPDFCRHAASYFFTPLLAAHHRDRVEIFCYANVAHPDNVTVYLQGLADHWCPTIGMTDQALASRIHDDGIDILVDLAGHTAGHRLGAFTYRPAPVQATYLGYCATTGLETMDYWITDAVIHPPATIERAVETIVRLPRCWVCYEASPEAPAVQPRPADTPLTFGCFNDRTKVTPPVIALWSRILKALPDAQLFLKARQYADANIREWMAGQFSQHGVEADRLCIEPSSKMAEYLAAYHEVDIALDPFPRTGGVTTADALWMGVPVITLAGQRFIERHSASLLTAIGHADWIAASETEYEEKVLQLANEPETRRRLRQTQRDTIAASPLANADDLAQHIEQSFRTMWNKYLAGTG